MGDVGIRAVEMAAGIMQLYSLEAEQAVLGSVLVNQDAVNDVALFLQPEDFYLVKHRWIWIAMLDLWKKREPIDVLTLAHALESRTADRDGKSQLDESGGQAYLTQLVTAMPTSVNAEAYGRIVLHYAVRRGFVELSGYITKSAYNDAVDVDGLRSEILRRVVQGQRLKSGAKPFAEYVDRARDEIEAAMLDPQDVFGLPTGFKDFNDATGGVQPGESMLILGEPRVGKTKFLIQLACQMAGMRYPLGVYRKENEPAYPGAIFEMEMKGAAIARREIAAKATVHPKALRTGRVREDQVVPILQTIDELRALPIYMDDATHWTTTSIRAEVSRLKDLYGIRWFAIDYIRLLKDRVSTNAVENQAYISQALKDICKDLDLAGIFIQAFNKEGMGAERPGLEHINGSAAFGYDADVVAILTKHKPDIGVARPNMRTLTFEKIREGESNRSIHFVMVEDGVPVFRDAAHQEDFGGLPRPRGDHRRS